MEEIDFIKSNYLSISIVVFIILGLILIFSIRGINLNPPKPESKLVQEVVVEGLDIMEENNEKLKMQPSESFCESYLGNSSELESACSQLTESNCNQTKCCVYLNGGKCVAGDVNGPTYKTDSNGQLITIDSYYYLGKCQGKCPT
jgi:hypothetical protein